MIMCCLCLNFTLKVDINHCSNCVEKAMNKLKKMDGIDSVKYDTAKEMLRVSGNIDPAMLIQKFDKWGRKAELYSFDKGKCKRSCSSKNKTHGVKIKYCDSSSDSNDDEDEESYDVHAPKNGSHSISWQDPSLMKSSPKEEIPMNNESANKSMKLFGGWFKKKDKATKASGNKNVSALSPAAASKWHFPRPSMPPAYGVPEPYGDQRLYHMNQYPHMMFPRPSMPPAYGVPGPYGNQRIYQYPPMMFPRPMHPSHGCRWMPPSMIPPQPQPYGYYQPRPPPRMNPMIHYTSYRDNYYP